MSRDLSPTPIDGNRTDQDRPHFGHSANIAAKGDKFSNFHLFGLSNSFPQSASPRGRLSSSSGSDGVNIEEVQTSLAQFGSPPSGTLVEASYCYHEPLSRRPTSILKEPLISANKSPTYGTLSDRDVECDWVNVEADTEGSKFILISSQCFWLVFTVVLLGYFIACFDSTLMPSSHPVITSCFGASQLASCLSTVFLITSTAFQPLFGRLSDTIGRKPVFLLVLAIFGLTTLWCALAGSLESFIVARAACGLGAGGTMSLGLIIVSDLVRIENRGVFQSHINLAFGLGSACGAALGGWLCDSLGWRWAFGLQVPVICLCFVLASSFTPSIDGPKLRGAEEGGRLLAFKTFDWLGSASLISAITCFILPLNLGGNIFPWTSPLVAASFAVAIIASCVFTRVKKRASQPLMPLHLLCRAPVANMVFANLLGAIASNTVLFNAPLFFRAVLLTSASSSGFRLAVPSLVGSLAGVSTGYIITYTRRLKPTLVFGSLMYLVGSVAILFMSKKMSATMSMVLITGVPLGQGFIFPNTMMSALVVSDHADQAVVTTTIGLWRNLGVVLGVAISSLVFQTSLLPNLKRYVADDAISRKVRSSVQTIESLEPRIQGQVIDAYAASLRITFFCAVFASVLILSLIVPIHLPRLRKGREVVVSGGE
ncbi:uncharacterized protein A1O5_01191 [Cladophialophora psammophila CBS 110553]|uniref:Major facilitator superfamily (MFS) profile domain-containing protein n=1 Tax=Cladophialophora psammophila CBS 110553 TaxID=1182543 RepID=W9X8V6_9EURO|nr:uncharacterized protein A1O5_01191 [Cladophialophora psammophila CBS 110553]EXJ76683.1 hypothetical protein A1O5_01191 [Cladophialophora psammophila CBS 110553]